MPLRALARETISAGRMRGITADRVACEMVDAIVVVVVST
jgi:hypothetical protein